MRIHRLLIASVLCAATYACKTTPTEPKAAAQPRSEPVYTTGSRSPSNSSAPVRGSAGRGGKTNAETPPGTSRFTSDAHGQRRRQRRVFEVLNVRCNGI